MKRTVGTVGVVGVMVSMTFVAAAPSAAAPAQNGCDSRTNNTQQKLLECVRLDGVVEHLTQFQAIADANGGTRADQTPGYEASVDYVVDVLEGAGWSAEVVPFTYDAADVVLKQLTPVVGRLHRLRRGRHGRGRRHRQRDPRRHQPHGRSGRTPAAASPRTSSGWASTDPATSL